MIQWETVRQQIFERDHHICQKCFDETKKVEIHHKIPRRIGGLDTLENLISYCRKCHKIIEPSPLMRRQPMINENYFPRIRIKEEDHQRLTKRVTYDKKIHDIVTEALDALDREVKRK